MKLGKVLYILAIVVLAGVFCVSAFYVGSYLTESGQQKSEYDELASMMENIQSSRPPVNYVKPTNPADSDTAAEATEPTEASILPEYLPLYEMNNDMVGWIKIEGTPINYPVMQTPHNPDFYLDHNFNGEYSRFGCIYARESCDINKPSDNVTLYGHHMRDNSMFASLNGYGNKAFYETHQLIFFDTLTEYRTYQVFAVFKTSASVGKGFSYHYFDNASSQEEFDSFVAQCKALSFYDTGHTPVYGDKLICLSTCEYTLENGRLVVVAYRVG